MSQKMTKELDTEWMSHRKLSSSQAQLGQVTYLAVA